MALVRANVAVMAVVRVAMGFMGLGLGGLPVAEARKMGVFVTVVEAILGGGFFSFLVIVVGKEDIFDSLRESITDVEVLSFEGDRDKPARSG